MFFQILRLFVLGFVILTAVYWVVSLYSRSVRREKLEKRWAQEGQTGDRDAYVEQGLADYDGSFRRKLIVAVYVVPFCIFVAVIWITNFG